MIRNFRAEWRLLSARRNVTVEFDDFTIREVDALRHLQGSDGCDDEKKDLKKVLAPGRFY